ncbi:hypothetical protein BDN72DRAFT_114507 [Pluteus cervinus]|uniref:Uncharacterized protein n=1 Tax=Pluteus cervinus TaxID=181527 RepID=A0ACD2ZXX6_9AGAR|nr:hypothetical protein BDN72DRAFT_114507 [Pluteus cervinus]
MTGLNSFGMFSAALQVGRSRDVLQRELPPPPALFEHPGRKTEARKLERLFWVRCDGFQASKLLTPPESACQLLAASLAMQNSPFWRQTQLRHCPTTVPALFHHHQCCHLAVLVLSRRRRSMAIGRHFQPKLRSRPICGPCAVERVRESETTMKSGSHHHITLQPTSLVISTPHHYPRLFRPTTSRPSFSVGNYASQLNPTIEPFRITTSRRSCLASVW